METRALDWKSLVCGMAPHRVLQLEQAELFEGLSRGIGAYSRLRGSGGEAKDEAVEFEQESNDVPQAS